MGNDLSLLTFVSVFIIEHVELFVTEIYLYHSRDTVGQVILSKNPYTYIEILLIAGEFIVKKRILWNCRITDNDDLKYLIININLIA